MNDFPIEIVVALFLVGLMACLMVLAGKILKVEDDPWPEERWQESAVEDER